MSASHHEGRCLLSLSCYPSAFFFIVCTWTKRSLFRSIKLLQEKSLILIIIVLSFTNRLSRTSLYLSLKTSFVYSNLFSLAKTVTIRCYIQTSKRVRSPSSACKKARATAKKTARKKFKSSKLVVEWRRLSRFLAKMTLVHARALLRIEKSHTRSRLRPWI